MGMSKDSLAAITPCEIAVVLANDAKLIISCHAVLSVLCEKS